MDMSDRRQHKQLDGTSIGWPFDGETINEGAAIEGVYFIRWGRYVKVGSAGDIGSRVRTIMLSIPEGEVEILGYIGGPFGWDVRAKHCRGSHEGAIHQALRSVHVRGEWFHDTPAIRQFIEKYSRPWPADRTRVFNDGAA